MMGRPRVFVAIFRRPGLRFDARQRGFRTSPLMALLGLALVAACSGESGGDAPSSADAPSAQAAASATDAARAPGTAGAPAGPGRRLASSVAVTTRSKATEAALPPVKVYKTASCGCCGLWVDHMRAAGFAVEAEDVLPADLVAIKIGAGMTDELFSCHTAIIGEHTFEGHIPAEVIARFLTEATDLDGLAVPGMPIGSPGMEVGSRSDPYDVIGYGADGRRTVYEKR